VSRGSGLAKGGLVLACLTMAHPARGYVRQHSTAGTPLYWRPGCIELRPEPASLPSLDPAVTLGEIERSAQA
jgi:hypothetical protein